ncbi:MAG: ABC transporter permease [Verrucomicrobia bacterium]|nr:ABC transporter permease [Verrucomicrobiota bacterium]
MTLWKLIQRSLRFHRRAHFGVWLSAIAGSAVLIGALAVGDSVRGSLRQMAHARLGRIDLALAGGDRFFRAALADDLESALKVPVAAAIQLSATVRRGDGAAQANQVQLLGVDDRFWQLADPPAQPPRLDAGQACINARLAAQLGVAPGDAILLRLPKPSRLSRDAPIAPQEDSSVAIRVVVHRVLSDAEFGRFGLSANQVAPMSAWLSRSFLARQLELDQRANLLLAARDQNLPVGIDRATAALRQAWALDDAQLELRSVQAQETELRTARVFLDAPVADAVLQLEPEGRGILTYLVNELRLAAHAAPYSMVAALNAPFMPPDMDPDEILINDWLAEDLGAQPGDTINLRYYVVGPRRQLQEEQRAFRVRGVLPLAGPAADPDLMPEFPGLSTAQNCRDWDAGFPIDIDRIRPKDEKYWDDHRGTPKGFVTLAAGQQMWANRFGNLTAIRFPKSAGAPAALGEKLRAALDPSAAGLFWLPVGDQAATASGESLDFGLLFLALSFFLQASAVLLMAMLFQFGLEQRWTEIGTLRALGFTPAQVRRLFLAEGALIAVLGTIVGIAGGIAYARLMIHALSTVWSGAVAAAALGFHLEPWTVLKGALAAVGVALAALAWSLRRQARQPIHELLTASAEPESAEAAAARPPQRGLYLATGAGAAGFLLMGLGGMNPDALVPAFFGAGTLFLIAGLGVAHTWLQAFRYRTTMANATWRQVALGQAARRPRRSLTTVALLASGAFLIVSVGANRIAPPRDWWNRQSGTGGFALVAESALPVILDLNTAEGRDFFGLDAAEMDGVAIVPFRVRDGDDASCLNLNRAQQPRLLGVPPRLLAQRAAFAFAQTAGGPSPTNQWMRLERRDGAVPAMVDQASMQWALGRKIGDALDYRDEHGQPFQVRLVGALAPSIFQGSLIIAEEEFVRRFPSETGYRLFLIDAPRDRVEAVSRTLSRALADVGLEITPTPRRLADFSAVQNTYLSTFQALGGLGLLLGSVGLAVVVLRNVSERRGELALLTALGFRRRLVQRMVRFEHLALLSAGLALGVGAALFAVLPAWLASGSPPPLGLLSLLLAGVVANGIAWTSLATRWAIRGDLLAALRNE